MLHPSTRRLVDTLYNLTAERRIVWTENDRGNGVYHAGGYEVEVCADPCIFRIARHDGRELEISAQGDLSDTNTDDGRSYDRIVRELAIDSVRIASGLEQAISSIMATLDKEETQSASPPIPDDGEAESAGRASISRIVDFAGETQKRVRSDPAVIAGSEAHVPEGQGDSPPGYSSWT